MLFILSQSGSGLNECEQILAAQGGVSCLCIDRVNGAIIAGIQSVIRVYDPDYYRLVQTNVGHGDAVRSIIHIRERSQVRQFGCKIKFIMTRGESKRILTAIEQIIR